ncbi:MAG: hypothetical protein LBC71_02830 [Oscillospiraceae bacterium]|jgi:hypothetical protein|nr:hypothetical protein [Oscillospiraceae bacterium]
MVKLIMGLKGSGKTKQMINLATAAVQEEQGDIVFIEKKPKLTFDLPHKVRLIDASQYDIDGYDYLKGLICGLHSSNYDISHIFIDSLLQIIKRGVDEQTDEFFSWCDSFSEDKQIMFTITISQDISVATPKMKMYV